MGTAALQATNVCLTQREAHSGLRTVCAVSMRDNVVFFAVVMALLMEDVFVLGFSQDHLDYRPGCRMQRCFSPFCDINLASFIYTGIVHTACSNFRSPCVCRLKVG